ncbi:ras GTPase-activating protein-binding protein 2-like [Solanum pennellii]|uniref:Ras GTPase-activating protein-binding protein 2-like n=1 Tax=Solanum pennellii TaxID=28526 RepID=A0ABM1FCC4_SOLPN|nr:ras GTPase-activating protein-binding protein 2-like [Solanum pennellii]
MIEQNINTLICSLDYKNYKAEIRTADAQDSFKDGVVVLVTGCLTGRDKLKRKFAQTFFLAPQDKGYFVLNDVFRYVEDNEIDTVSEVLNGTEDVQSEVLTPDPEPTHVVDPPNLDQAGSPAEEVLHVEEKANDSSVDGRQVADEREIVVETGSYFNEDQHPTNTELANFVSQEDAPKKSGIDVPEANDAEDEAEGYSIYVRNLPLDVTVAQLEAEFKTYGPIKQGGVQQQGFCFGFVEFEDMSSMNSAIQASPIIMGARQVVIEMKRTTTIVGNIRGRFSPRRGVFQNENFRVRGIFGGGLSYRRSEFGGRNFSGCGRVPGGRGGESYQWP